MNYNYEDAKRRIYDVLNSKTEIQECKIIPNDESEFTYDNGIRTWVGAMFIDIRNSTNYFKDNKSEIVARIMRAFCAEIISLLKQNDLYRQIGIRGDCVYAIYSTPEKSDTLRILHDSFWINTFQKMFQKILSKKEFPEFEIGIGLGLNKDLVIKAGKKNSGIRDYIWIGDAVVDASKLSGQGNKDGFATIVMDSCFYDNIKDFKSGNETYSNLIASKYSNVLKENVYHCNRIMTEFNAWIEENI